MRSTNPKDTAAGNTSPQANTTDRKSIGSYGDDPTRDEERAALLLGVGQRLAAARQQRHLTQKQFSERVGKSRATIVQYEQGRLQPPLDQIILMARALDVAPEQIAFGLQAIAGLEHETANVASLPEVELRGKEQKISGAHGFASGLVDHLGVEPDRAKVYVVTEAAPAFWLSAGDRIIVNAETSFEKEGRLYAIRTPRGLAVVRLLPGLSASNHVNLNGSYGETLSYDPRDLEVLGLVVGSIQAR